MSVAHPGLGDEAPFRIPSVPEDWDANMTGKMTALLVLLRYHLSRDGVPIVTTSEEGQLQYDREAFPNLEARETILPPNTAHPTTDKIVVYAAFPCNNPLIRKASIDHSR